MPTEETTMNNLVSKVNKISNILNAIIDLLIVKGLVTSEEFVLSYEEVLRTDDIKARRTKLAQSLYDSKLKNL